MNGNAYSKENIKIFHLKNGGQTHPSKEHKRIERESFSVKNWIFYGVPKGLSTVNLLLGNGFRCLISGCLSCLL